MGFWSKFKKQREEKKNNKNKEIISENIIDENEITHDDEENDIIDENETPETVDEENEISKSKSLNKEVDVFSENEKKEKEQQIINDESKTLKNDEVLVEEPKIIDNENKQDKHEIKAEKKEIKLEEKRLKKAKKEKEKQQKAEKVMLKSALTFSKDIKKLSKKYKQADDDFFEELEEVLIKTDIGMKMVLTISKNLQKKVKENTSFDEVKEMLTEEIYDIYHTRKDATDLNYKDGRLNIFMIVGVNGTGKTTSIAKLAAFYASQGKKVLIAAGDTFRAGAVEQLDEWVKTRLKNIDLYKGTKKNEDPSSVIFDAIKVAQENNYDLLLIDTAGRLQNKVNLMKELEKMHSIVHKYDKHAPHEVLLVIDSTTGQNGVIQAKSFSEVTKISGIILTKMDGTSKGGIALAIKDELNIPVKLVGVGEQIDDLIEFNVDDYIYGLVSGFMEDNGEEE